MKFPLYSCIISWELRQIILGKEKLYWEICQNILGNLSWVLCLAYVQFFMGKYPRISLLVSRAKPTKLQYIYKILPRTSHEIPTIYLHNILGITAEYLEMFRPVI